MIFLYICIYLNIANWMRSKRKPIVFYEALKHKDSQTINKINKMKVIKSISYYNKKNKKQLQTQDGMETDTKQITNSRDMIRKSVEPSCDNKNNRQRTVIKLQDLCLILQN